MCDNIAKDCNCPNENCSRHGRCMECVAFHREKKNKPPFCIRNVQWTEM